MFKVASRPHPFSFSPQETVLLVIDVQNDFCHAEGFCIGDSGMDGRAVRAIIEPLQRVVAWARDNGVEVMWTKEAHRPDLSDLAASKKLRYENAGYPVGALGARGRYLVRGEWGSQVLEEMQARTDEIQLDKPAQSAFPFTDLEEMLRGRSIKYLLLAGVTTQCCVLATYRSASDLGFFALLLEDCCASFDPSEHQAAVKVLVSEGGAVGWVATSDQLMQATSTFGSTSGRLESPGTP